MYKKNHSNCLYLVIKNRKNSYTEDKEAIKPFNQTQNIKTRDLSLDIN